MTTISLDTGSGGALLATSLVGSDHVQHTRPTFGTGSSSTIVDSGTPLPVALREAVPAGTAMIGQVNVSSMVATPAGTNMLGQLNVISGVGSSIQNTTAVSVLTAPGAGLRNYITSILITNASSTIGSVVHITSSGDIKWRGWAAAQGGAAPTMPTPLRMGTNEPTFVTLVTSGPNIDVTLVGFKAP